MAPLLVALGYGAGKNGCVPPLPREKSSRRRPRMVLTGRRQLVFSPIVLLGFAPPVLLASEGDRQRHFAVDEIEQIIRQDIEDRQYYVTGDLTRSIYSDDCRFIDPTTNVQGVDSYVAAVKSLFDPSDSKHELLEIRVTSPTTIEAKWRLQGSLKLPWKPHIAAYEGTTTYTLNDDGFVASHKETWDISLLTAFIEFLTPSFR
ncbi:uncharacterized protein LOC9649028 [Selaginella moellendorffii]|nr:uncharacterized protein LOC9649028 [Selaginella moellendorffii]|eukprot:XP_002976492.2 uncharacterized protein LOC9649028 [Selaginella moellendorffii]